MNRISSFFILTVICLFPLLTIAQTMKTTVDAKTPEVVAFNRFIETPVSYFTGVPAISIPLYEITINGVSVPISLDYHAGGIRVDQDATWVGLGWSLNYGGQISRTVRGGIADEKCFFLDTTIKRYLALPNAAEDQYLVQRGMFMWYAKHPALIQNDLMPDEFYYNFLGFSGRYMYDQNNKKFVLFPKEDLTVKYQLKSTYNIDYWTLQLPDGTKGTFKRGTESSIGGPNSYADNSWVPTKIENQYNDSITFSYDTLPAYTIDKVLNESFTKYRSISSPGYVISSGTCYYHENILKQIKFRDGKIDFYTTTRVDMPNKALSKIVVSDNQGKVIKSIVFNYSYFTADAYKSVNYTWPVATSDYANKRLKLDSLDIYGSDVAKVNTYKFDYYTYSQMPSKFSAAQDHWGFFNAYSNTTTIPNIAPDYIVGGDRRVKGDTSKVFSLKSITFPEGGKTEYIYEGNNIAKGYGQNNIPWELESTYQDDNFTEKSMSISISGYDRNNFTPAPDSTTAIAGERYYKKYFTVPEGSFFTLDWDFISSTNIGQTSIDKSLNISCMSANVNFDLYLLNNDGSISRRITSHTAVDCSSGTRTPSTNQFVKMSAGKYLMQVQIFSNVSGTALNQPHSTFFQIKWREPDANGHKLNIGGIRVKQINTYDMDGSLALQKQYDYADPNTKVTSGQVLSMPQYIKYMYKQESSGNAGYGLQFLATSKLPLESTSGSYAGYKYVTEKAIGKAGDTLKTRYSFDFSPSLFSEFYSGTDLWQYEQKEWSRGKLLTKEYLKGNATIAKEEYTYNFYSPHLNGNSYEDTVREINTDFISFWKVTYHITPSETEDFYDPQVNPGGTYPGFHYGEDDYKTYTISGNPIEYYQVQLPIFYRLTGFDKIQSKKITTYDDNGNSIVQTENYYYDKTPGHYQLTRMETTDSKNNVLKTVLKYPLDKSSLSGTTTNSSRAIDSLVKREVKNTLLETDKFKAGTLVERVRNDYRVWPTGNTILQEYSQFQKGTATMTTQWQAFNYDSSGNLLEQANYNDAHTAYIWNYNRTSPIAIVHNATIADVAYCGFEDAGTGNWTVPSTGVSVTGGITGAKSWTISGNITKSGLTASQTYIISYWSKTGSATVNGSTATSTVSKRGWNYFEHKVSGVTSVTITGSITIDELRLYPADAKMTTNTYNPLVGLTSQCDPANHIFYYEYDGIGRLKVVRDMDGNVMKVHDYHYKN